MNPAGTLELDPEGNLYGTTTGGGPPNQNLNGCGTVFKLDTTGGYNVLLGFNSNGFGTYGGGDELVVNDGQGQGLRGVRP